MAYDEFEHYARNVLKGSTDAESLQARVAVDVDAGPKAVRARRFLATEPW
jgi:hypothetical protein